MTEKKVKSYLDINGKLVACQKDYSQAYIGTIPGIPEEADFLGIRDSEDGIPILEFNMRILRKKKWRRKNSKRHSMRKSKQMRRFWKGAERITSGKLSLKRVGPGVILGSLDKLNRHEREMLNMYDHQQRAAMKILTATGRPKIWKRGSWMVKQAKIAMPVLQREEMENHALELSRSGLVKEDDNFCGGFQKLYKFNNGHGASVVWHKFSRGHEYGFWEVAFLSWNGEEWETEYYEPFGDSTSYGMTTMSVNRALKDISEL